MLRGLILSAAVTLAATAAANARDNAPSDGTDMRFFLCMAEGGTEISIPLVGTLCCNPDWCVLCDSNLNNCREVTPSEARLLQNRPRLQQIVPQSTVPLLAPD
ncbi:MAG: hypothetical protein R3F55_10020 [Alphaproteobacteria bacterium]